MLKGQLDSTKRMNNLIYMKENEQEQQRGGDRPDVNLVNNFCIMKGFKSFKCSQRIGNTYLDLHSEQITTAVQRTD